MSLTSGFFNSVNGDRTYNAEQMSSLFDGVINDGIYSSVGGCFMVSSGTDLGVIVQPGRAWFNSTWTLSDASIPLSLDTADSVRDRIDAIILEVNSSDATRINSITVVKGVPASSPAKPTLTVSDEINQHALAYVTVSAAATTITASNIENVVGTDETPFVTGILETATISTLFADWQEQFDAWFENLIYILSGDVAGKMQTEINDLLENSYAHHTGTTVPSESLGKNGDIYAKTW